MSEKKVSDTVLVNQFKKGSIDAFEELIERYQTKVYNLAMRFMRNHEDTEEVIQDVFSVLYTKMDGFRGNSAFSSWLYRIVVNAAFMRLRKRKQQQTTSIEDLSPTTRQNFVDQPPNVPVVHSESLAIRHQLRDALEDSVNKLPEQYRAVFVLRDVDGLSNQEVSEILDLSIPAVKSRLHRSRLMLRKRLLRCFREFIGRDPVPVDDGIGADLDLGDEIEEGVLA